MRETEFNKRELTGKDVDDFIRGDYPQRGPERVSSFLMYVEEGLYSSDQFFEKLKPEDVMSFKQYLEQYLEPEFGFSSRTSHLPDATKTRIEKIEVLIEELQSMLRSRKPLKEIYKHLKRFSSEAGMHITSIPTLET